MVIKVTVIVVDDRVSKVKFTNFFYCKEIIFIIKPWISIIYLKFL